MRKILMTATTMLALSGCAQMLPVTNLYENPNPTNENLAGISWHNVSKYKGAFGAQVTEIDGKPVSVFSMRALIEPGDHLVTVECYQSYDGQGNLTIGGQKRKRFGSKRLRFEAGKNYFIQGRNDMAYPYTPELFNGCEPQVYAVYKLNFLEEKEQK